MIAWNDLSTEVLLNPRLAENEADAAVDGIRSLVDRRLAPAGHLWISTSGSSGQPKWVGLSRRAVLASASATNLFLQSDARDVWLSVLPEFHVGGLGIRARAFLSGARVVRALSEKWNAETFLEEVIHARATLASLVPTQVHDLVTAGIASPPGLRAILVGGAALAPDLYREARVLGWNLLPSYGSSECASQIATAPLSSLGQNRYPALRTLPHLEARLIDDKLAFRGASVFSGYVLTEATGWRFEDPKRDGWFVSEDLGEIDGPHLRPLGRATDFFKIGAEGTSLTRLQEIWEREGGRGVIVAVPDERLGHVVHLVCEGDAEPLGRFHEHVLPFERVREVHTHFSIPRSPLGKPLRAEILRALRS